MKRYGQKIGHTSQRERSGRDPSLTISEGLSPTVYLIFELPASRTVRQKICIIESTPFVTLLQQPRKTDVMSKSEFLISSPNLLL